jgi:hypothetical protein
MIIGACASLFFASQIACYNTTPDIAWLRFGHILIFDFLLIFVALRVEVIRLIGLHWFKLISYILINHFIDSAFGFDGYTWNDFITIMIVLLEFIIYENELFNKRSK